MEPFAYISQIQGKGFRKSLMDAFNSWLQVDEKQVESIADLISILHNSSLLIDDIEDNSKLRRGLPVAHSLYGIPLTINTANYMYFIAMEKVYNTGNPEAVKVFLEELLNLHRGQGYDIVWRDNNSCPTEEQYIDMVLDKTGGLFRLCLRLMQVFSGDTRDYIPLVNLLGLYFQIRDDYINLKSEDYAKNKSFAEDLTEGKFSFPIIFAIRSNQEDHRLLNILKLHTEDAEIKKHAIDYMQKVGAFSYTETYMADLATKIRKTIQDFGGNPKLTELFEFLEKSKV
uniref:Geranylgeranyl pyrophosphate synthase n=1 Tax=Arcella intermedia TaxID=1963864 RepID=A0A6B2LD06_9EUKA